MAQQEIEETQEERQASTKKWGRIALIAAGVIGVLILFNVLTGGDEPELRGASADAAEVEGPPPVEILDSIPADFEPWSGTRALSNVVPEARADAYSSAPPMTIDPTASYIATIDTDAGSMSFDLFAEQSPVTVNNFVNLANDGFYDGVAFHRVLEDFMAQGGDPTGTGGGGPGYRFQDEFESGLAFDKVGLLAMANAGPATNGSQFFITFDVDATAGLTGRHTIFGEVIRNPEVLDAILRVDPGSGDPTTVINAIRIVEG